jgi:hypothetical protein
VLGRCASRAKAKDDIAIICRDTTKAFNHLAYQDLGPADAATRAPMWTAAATSSPLTSSSPGVKTGSMPEPGRRSG